MTKFQSLLPDLENAVKRLESVLEQPKNEFIRDSAIQRFEFCFDLAWKTLKSYLEEAIMSSVFRLKPVFAKLIIKM